MKQMPEITHFPAERALSDRYRSVCHRGGEGLDWARLDTAIRPEQLECLRFLPPLLSLLFFFFCLSWTKSLSVGEDTRTSDWGLWRVSDRWLTASSWVDGAHILSPNPPNPSLRAVFDLRVMTWSRFRRGLFCFSAQFNPQRPPRGVHSWLHVDAVLQWHHCSIQIPKLCCVIITCSCIPGLSEVGCRNCSISDATLPWKPKRKTALMFKLPLEFPDVALQDDFAQPASTLLGHLLVRCRNSLTNICQALWKRLWSEFQRIQKKKCTVYFYLFWTAT